MDKDSDRHIANITRGLLASVPMSYEPRKAAQTIAYLAIKNGRHPLNVMKAVKLVYLADRESVRRHGFPIQDEPRASMMHGPVNSETYRFINGEKDPSQCGWAEHLNDRENHRVGLRNRDVTIEELDELSDADIASLDAVWDQFGQMDQWQLRDWTHAPNNVPEWEDPGSTSTSIPLERLMRALNVENAAQQAAAVESLGLAKSVLKSL